jgi:hypothetical protein
MSLLSYAQRWAGGFADNNGAKPADAQFLNAVETALLGLLGAAPTDGQVSVYDNALGRFKTLLLTNAHIDPAAAIAKSKLAALALVDADVSAGAAIAASKLAGNIPASKLASYPASSTSFLRGDGTWVPAMQGLYRKTTAKQVVNSVVETDLLNGEITVGAGVMGTNGVLRLTAWGDLINNTGGTVATPRFKLKLGATTLLDTNTIAAVWSTNAARWGWEISVKIINLGVANSQWATLLADITANTTVGGAVTFTTGEGEFSAYTPGAQWKAIGGTSGAVDTTVGQVLALTVTLATANALEDVTLKGALVEVA